MFFKYVIHVCMIHAHGKSLKRIVVVVAVVFVVVVMIVNFQMAVAKKNLLTPLV